ncbi:hypothetical protein T265_00318 [Opisthorchis viverrini]|uniref:Guanine nucleotide-binding protein alpha-13 subunit n=2 Tax=Opisthorchis viverrini TaxID=6198 RepID=A0A075AJS1_OPIVI|nr:hypothetical protein T265_00318 [Opisthorchis viverrini]KER33874.1 hypothetical protein T265_00318 [Opisthorchis viverrini]
MTLLCCAVTHSPEEENEKKARKVSRSINKRLKQSQKADWKCLKLLLLGTGESGKSTILKQMKIIHINGYTESEKKEFILPVYKNIRDAMMSLLGGMRVLSEEFGTAENAKLAKDLLDTSFKEDSEYPPSFFDAVERLWNDQGVQRVFTKANEYQLLDSAKYFLDRIGIIRQADYIPSDQDILRCRTMTDGINEVRFDIQTGRKTSVRFRVFDVSGQRGARKKWIQLFDNVTAILFLVDSSSFDQTLREDRNQNRMVDSLEVFEQAWNNKYLQSVPMIVFLNKIDVLDEKIHAGQRITRLYSFAANWIDMYEMRSSVFSPASLADSRDQFLNLHDSLLSCYSQTNDFNDGTAVQTPVSRFPNTSVLRKIDENASQDCDGSPLGSSLTSPTKHSTPNDRAKMTRRPSQTSFRWRQSSFSRTLNTLTPKNSIRRFRRSFRQATFIPINPMPSSCGQKSRLSCTVAVTQVIVQSPYHKFEPSVEEQYEFTRAIQYIERQPHSLAGLESTDLRELRPPHRETIRTACYIKHLFQELTKQKPSGQNQLGKRRHCLFYYTCAVSTDSVKKVLDACRKFLIEDHLERFGLL